MRKLSHSLSKMMLPVIPVFFAVAGLPAAHAGTVYSTGFENPPFTVGPIAGQDGWSVFGPGLSAVTSSFAFAGSQSVFVDGATASQSGPYHSDSPSGPIIDLSAEIAIFTSSTQSEWQFAATGPGLSQYLGGIDVFANNSIEALTSGFPIIGVFPRATAFNGTAWHDIDIQFNMTTQTYNVTLDGTTLATNLPFCGNNSGPCSGAFIPSYGTSLFDSFGVGGTANDSGYMDNFSLSNVSAVPEPSALLLIAVGLGAVAALAKRRQSF